MLTSLCLAFFAIGGDDPILDIVELGNGKKLEGIILQVTDDEIILAQGSRNKSIPREKVSNLSGPRQEYPNYILKLQGLLSSSPSAPEVLDLADWCMEHGLPWDANALQHFALVIDPGNEKAHLALGHKKFKDSWKAKLKSGNRIRWESIQEKRLEFSNAWEFKTAHFEVRAAGPLKDTLLACFELEQFYSLFYSLFQKQVGFHELQNPIKVFIYPNLSEFPPQSGIEGAYFDPNNRVLHTFFDEAVAKSLLHEATHALLFYSGRELERRDPEFPGWLDEGLACYLEAGLGNTPGLVEFDESIIAMHRFQA
ncbi:MAG: hypothetical protein QF524_08840, partial [Planctomycetota bacterium]|nr:hypothetical protein [Planctomycetota bacterium]